MSFKASFCDPFKPYVIELGNMEADNIVETFEKINWEEYLKKMLGRKASELYYSPSYEVVNNDNQQKLSISAVGIPGNFEYYIFYKRPKKVKTFFGLSESLKKNYMSEVKGQSKKDVSNCLQAFIKNDAAFLDDKIKK